MCTFTFDVELERANARMNQQRFDETMEEATQSQPTVPDYQRVLDELNAQLLTMETFR